MLYNCSPKQTERQKDRKTERQKVRKTERQTDRITERQKDRKTVRQKDRKTESQKDIRQTKKKLFVGSHCFITVLQKVQWKPLYVIIKKIMILFM